MVGFKMTPPITCKEHLRVDHAYLRDMGIGSG